MSDAQVRTLMQEFSEHGEIGVAAMTANMDRKTARKYVNAGKMPSEMKTPRRWRTREDPFDEHWPEVEALLTATPALETKTVFGLLQERHPDRYEDGQLRTLQRRVRAWRATSGPEREVVLGQEHRPGEAAQTDFTSANALGVTIAGEAFPHLLGVFVLPYSNWTWATVCLSESIAAIRKVVQRSVFQLGRRPAFHQTDNSTAATHRGAAQDDTKSAAEPKGQPTTTERTRPFNDEYLALMRHFGMTPRTIEVGASEQNGDVESSNGALKRRLEQALLLRGSRAFSSVEDWQGFVDEQVRKANKGRSKRVAEEFAAMTEVNVNRLPEHVELLVRVTERGTINVKHCAYSLPSRLRDKQVKVRLHEDRIEVYFNERLQLSCERVIGRRRRIDYRHVIWSLVRKPGGFARYAYREEMFPTAVFKSAYEAIRATRSNTAGDLEYLRILHLAASTMEADVQAALSLLLSEQKAITIDAVKALVVVGTGPSVPAMTLPDVDLTEYDALLVEVGT